MPEPTRPPVDRLEVEAAPGVTLVGDGHGPGDGRPVLLLHGGGQTRHAWRGTAGILAEAGWRAGSFDLRGHGESSWAPDADYAIDAFAADARLVAATLGERAVFVGASLGGIASLVAVGESDAPMASGVVLVDVAPRISRQGVGRITDFMTNDPDGFASMEEVADAIAAYHPHRPRPTDLDGLRRNVRQRPDGRRVGHCDPAFLSGHDTRDETRALAHEERLRDAARALTVPVLLVRGLQSDLLEEDGAADLMELVPHARYVQVGGAGHMVAGDRNDGFNEAIVGFLDDLPE